MPSANASGPSWKRWPGRRARSKGAALWRKRAARDETPGAAARAALHIKMCHPSHECLDRLDHQRRGRRQIEQVAASGQLYRLVTVRQQAAMANPLDPSRQHMGQKAADELHRRQGHHPAMMRRRIAHTKRYGAMVQTNDAVVRDRHAVGIARQIVKHLRRPTHRCFGIHHPLMLVQRSHQIAPGQGSQERILRQRAGGGWRSRAWSMARQQSQQSQQSLGSFF